jgi:hypothetical protein
MALGLCRDGKRLLNPPESEIFNTELRFLLLDVLREANRASVS